MAQRPPCRPFPLNVSSDRGRPDLSWELISAAPNSVLRTAPSSIATEIPSGLFENVMS